MRPGPLVVGLGNPFNGDGGVGVRILELLALDSRLPEHVEMLSATPEFVRQKDYLVNRTRVILLDAFRDDEVGAVRVMNSPELHALALSDDSPGSPITARHAVDLLEEAEPGLAGADFTVVGVAVGTAALVLRPGLSDPVEAGARLACDRVLALLMDS